MSSADVGHSMKSAGTDSERASLEAEHRQLISWAAKLERTAEDLARGQPPDDLKALALEIQSLTQHLRHHFEKEEKPEGLYGRIGRAHPAACPELARLRDQHRIFLSWGDELLASAERPASDLRSLGESLTAFFRLLARHERREAILASTHLS